MARAATTSDVFNAVAEPRRREILNYLALLERPVGEIVDALEMEQPSVSKHLRVLKDVGLVHARRDGRQMFYRTNAAGIRPLYEWAGTFERFWRHQLIRVKERAEEKSGAVKKDWGNYFGGGTMSSMAAAMVALENLTLNITQEIHVKASPEVTFEALLEQLGPGSQVMDGTPMPMKLEAWPGGRWFRDLGDGNGHFWGNVQAIKRPTLLEFTGPLFMSYPVVSNVQYRLSETDGGTLIKFHHAALGLIQDDHRRGVTGGWSTIHERVRKVAEAQEGLRAGSGPKQ
jgi:DNA-binding transcriptional ArsR family regulator